jgi:hypothetical protein
MIFNFYKILSLGLVALITGGCSLGIFEEEKSEQKSFSHSQLNPLEPSTGSILSVGSLFQNDSLETPANLDEGLSTCGKIIALPDFEGVLHQWPSELSRFGTRELERFPDKDLLLKSLNGIFLIDGNLLDFQGAGGQVAGLMCDNAIGDNFIFLNYEMFVTERAETGPIGEWQQIKGIINKHIVTSHGDQFVFTLIHEIFHAVDHKSFLYDRQESAEAQKRDQIIEETWVNPETSRFEEYDDVIMLTGKNIKLSCGKIDRSSKTFGLTESVLSSGDDLAVSYKEFYENTNFISFYASTNSYEDFADTLATWYFARTYNNGLNRVVYKEDLSDGNIEGATKLYEFDTIATLAKSAFHQSKVCALVSLVFSMNCEI